MLLPGRHICILGDMLELGPDEAALHFETGRYALEMGIDAVYTFGTLSRYISEAAHKIDARHYDEINDLISDVSRDIRENDIILIKASRGMHFERISEALKNL